MTEKTRFRPATALESEILASTKHPGWVYFASDTGKIFFDVDPDTRLLMGGGGASILYGKAATLSADEDSDDVVYNFPIANLESYGADQPQVNPKVKDIILNIPDGRFYRVEDVRETYLICTLLAVSGSGSGGGAGTGGDVGGGSSISQKIKVSIQPLATSNLINGQDFSLIFKAESSYSDAEKTQPLDEQLIVYLTLEEKVGNSYTPYWTGQLDVAHNTDTSYDFTELLRQSTTTRISVRAEGIESGMSAAKTVTVTTASLTLDLSSSFSTITRYAPTKMILSCEAVGSMNKILKFYWDGALVETRKLSSTADNTQTYAVNSSLATHGAHKVRIELYQAIVISNVWSEALSVPALEFEVAIEGTGTNDIDPIIWLGEYKSLYYNYDSIQIPYLVYDPQASGTTVEVVFKKNGQTIRTANPTNASANVKTWNIWEISDADLNMINYYSISCGGITRDISFTVEQDPNRSMELVQQDYLALNFEAKGRSNTESTTSRAMWDKDTYRLIDNVNPDNFIANTYYCKNGQDKYILADKYDKNTSYYRKITGSFDNFNWYNNGWVLDNSNQTCLRISNGAKFSIPYGAMMLNTSNKTNQSVTFETQFKIRNVQNYGKLISNITRYSGDDEFYKAFKAQSKYDNYDSFLHYYLPIYPVENESLRQDYDDLKFDKIQKEIAIDRACASFYAGSGSNIVGFGIGAQDAFFSNGRDIVNVSYVEDQVVNLSMVYSYSSKMLYIYLNGVITGVIKNSSTGDTFTIGADEINNIGQILTPAVIEFSSEFCDIDLYRFRIYTTDLNVNEIVQNYSVDLKDITTFDQNSLAKDNSVLNEYQFSYEKMIEYNESHKTAPLMPYIIFDTSESGEDVLSYSKKVNRIIGVEFVNTGLELAYQNGELLQWAIADGLCSTTSSAEEKAAAVKKYYLHHCPSWTGKNINMAVQGTSSEFYPRRNYKLKTKTDYDADKEERTHIFLNRGPYADDYQADKEATANFTKFTTEEKQVAEDGTETIKKNDIDCKSRQSWFYFNNYDVGANKFTCKIDYMESSGSYNMGFANLVKNAYSKHPLDDYNKSNAFSKVDKSKLDYVEVTADTQFDENATYSYVSHKGEWKDIALTAEQLQASGNTEAVVNIWKELKMEADNKIKILCDSTLSNAATASNKTEEELQGFMGKWFIKPVISYLPSSIDNISDSRASVKVSGGLRTSCEGFRVLAFHKKSKAGTSGSQYQYIGMYNILSDKGSDEMYGFKPNDSDVLASYVDHKAVKSVAECWEFENNSRGFCSFRDPWNRKELSFKAPDSATNKLTAALAPIVADSFEYRYHTSKDYLDLLYELKTTMANKDNAVSIEKAFPGYSIFGDNPADGQKLLLKLYENWEKAVQWVWSTNTDNVASAGQYEQITVGDKVWEPDTYYIFTPVTYFDEELNEEVTQEVYAKETSTPGQDSYYSATSNQWYVYSPTVADRTYYIREEQKDKNGNTIYNYKNAYAGTNIYEPEKYYICVDEKTNTYSLCSNEEFDSSLTYYSLSQYDDTQLASIADRLVVPATGDFDEEAEYYTYNKDATVIYSGTNKIGNVSTILVENPTEEDFLAGKYYVATEKTYGQKTYKFDTKEYRADKFKYELEKHFDIEYMATYFIMTEVFECYDSRGKNCMMASWGPLTEGGEYIWYPIFYDIDTQLGINNTGIPSFEFNVDATEDGNYSTSDSILWNNFYKYFKSSYVTQKYKQLKGITDNIPASWGGSTPLTLPPLKNIETIEKWYTTDPYCAGNVYNDGSTTYKIPDYEKIGARPLIATNLDAYYKYITITNTSAAGIKSGECGKLTDEGTYSADTSATFFYALQGDRSLSRQQFLTNRMEYMDSWLNQGNYQRGGQNRIVGRVAANNAEKTSDRWVNDGYYDADGHKLHGFDAEYWVNLTPIRSSYVTLSDDNAAYPSQKYDGVTPVKFEISAIENGVKNSANYPEQLLYIYGMNQMADLGDMSNLYWQEFKIEGDASKLTALRLGYDGLMVDAKGEYVEATETGVSNDIVAYNGKKYYRWHNDKMNLPTIPASDEDEHGMPLLKEINLSNITINTGSPTINLTSCEKLENFRATGSNFSTITFADGVALNTLYLPSSITSLQLTEANLLTKLLKTYEYPKYELKSNKLNATPGLYIQGLFDADKKSNILTLNLTGGALGYGSYELLKQWYDCRTEVLKATLTNKPTQYLNLTKVNWCPFVQLVDGDIVDEAKLDSYYLDDGHYGFVPYNTTYNRVTVNTDIANGIVYYKDPAISDETINQIADVDMFDDFITNNYFLGVTNNAAVPNITGIIYVNNATAIDETYIRNTLGVKYPQLTFFFAKVNKAYTAKFIIEDENGIQTYVAYKDAKITEKSIQKIDAGWFDNPYALYNPEKEAHDFHGWSTTNDDAGLIASVDASETAKADAWEAIAKKVEENVDSQGEPIYDYTFYAVFTIHQWNMEFYAGINANNVSLAQTVKVTHGEVLTEPSFLVAYEDESLGTYEKYRFLGWTQNINALLVQNEEQAKLVNFASITATTDMKFYAVYIKEDVRKTPTDDRFFRFEYLQNVSNEYDIYNEAPMTGWRVWPADGVSLAGKITIPTTHTDSIHGTAPVVSIAGFGLSATPANITGIFWCGDDHLIEFYGDSYGAFQSAFDGCRGLKVVDIPKTTRFIGRFAFRNCSSLNLDLSPCQSLLAIGYSAFNVALSSSMSSLTIPGSVRRIDTLAFSYLTTSLSKISVGGIGDPVKVLGVGNTAATPTGLGQPAFVGEGGSEIHSLIFYFEGGTPTEYVSSIFGPAGGKNAAYANVSGQGILVNYQSS